MVATALASFRESLDDLDVPVTRTTAADTTDVLAALAERPAVGSPLPLDGVTMPSHVETRPTPNELDDAATGITGVELAVADYGSVVVADTGDAAEHASLFADTHVAVVGASDVVGSMRDAVEALGPLVREGLTSAVLATGPSATADMGALVTGVHGPTDVHVVLVEDR